MDSKTIGVLAIVAVLAGGIGFYAGNAQGKSSAASAFAASRSAGFAGGARGGRGGMTGGSFASGQVISKDATGITLQLQGGGSAVVLFGTSTPVMKSATGTTGDIAVGSTITVTGIKNSDGSITAQSVQIRPAGMNAMNGQAQGPTPGTAASQ